MTAYTGGMPTFTTGVKTGNAARLNQIRDLGLAFTDAWTALTPGISGWTLGNGISSAKWARAGKVVFFRCMVQVGSTTVIGGQLQVALPANIKDTVLHASSSAVLEDVGAAWYQAASFLDVSQHLVVRRLGAGGLMDSMTSTLPFTWAAGDRVYASAIYETA